jgi:three-Cys-motif partner protein
VTSERDRHPEYWDEYTNLQRVKHDLIHHYLNGWFPKLGLWAGRILYIDTHAGRGKHRTGDLGSPLVALTTLLSHRGRDRILSASEVRFVFIEIDEHNLEQLQSEVERLGTLPKGAIIEVHAGEAFQVLQDAVSTLRETGQSLAPAFVFVDPYGFKIPCAVLRDLMTFEHVELFVTMIWRELDMAIAQADDPGGMAETVDLVFGGSGWRSRIVGPTFEDRARQAADLLREQIGAKWATHFRMLGDNNATRYLLLHLTNHDAGRDLMKEVMWKINPEGGFHARKSDNPDQEVLILPKPDLAPLRRWILGQLEQGPVRWQEFAARVRHELWLPKHLNQSLHTLRREGAITAPGPEGRFSSTANPLIRLAKH